MNWYQDTNCRELERDVRTALARVGKPIGTTQLMEELGASRLLYDALAKALKIVRGMSPELVEIHEGKGAFGKSQYRWRIPVAK